MRRLALAALALLLLTGCNLSIAVGVDVHGDGSGVVRATVTLDREAYDRLKHAGGRLEAADLKQAGWTVTGPTASKDGGALLVASKPFRNPGELDAVIEQVGGARKPLHDFRLTRRTSFAKTTTEFRGVVDLRGGVAVFGDDRLKQQTGADAGLDPAELERQAGVLLNKFFTIEVAVRLPGSVSSNAPTHAGNGAVWHPRLGELANLSATGAQVDTLRIVALGVAGGAGIALVIVLALRRRRI